MSTESSQTLIPSPVGQRSENLGGIQIVIHHPESNSYASAVASSSEADSRAAERVQALVPSDPLRTATDSLNSKSHQNPPTGGKSSKMEDSKTRKKTNGKQKKSGKQNQGSHSSSVICNNCGQRGHIKKGCRSGPSPQLGTTRGEKASTLIAQSVKDHEEQVVGAEVVRQQEAQLDAEESAPVSAGEPESTLPQHYSSLTSPLQNLQAERLQLERVLSRCSTTDGDKPSDAFQFWIWKFGFLYLLSILVQFIILGHWTWLCILSQSPLVVLSVKALWLDCKEKRWLYEAYLSACQIYADRVIVQQEVPSTYDEGIKYKTELRVDSHALKDAELAPYLFQVSVYKANDKHWAFNLCFPEQFKIPAERMVISSTLLKHSLADVDFFNDTKQLLLRSQIQCLRNQRVGISAEDIAIHGDVYGNTALVATFHNEKTNSSKRRMMDFLRSPMNH